MNNTVNTTNLIQAAINAKVKKFIFSSTAAVYGEPTEIPMDGVDETFPAKPINPYGMSKLMSETILADTAKAHPAFQYITQLSHINFSKNTSKNQSNKAHK
jgi:UDP-glucose 4-epimerase